MLEVSVIICSHNPRSNYLRRVLEALEHQTLEKERWEILLVDNCSDPPLEKQWNLTWHPRGRHVREGRLGVTYAHFQGIGQAEGELLVFVDDDNVLEIDYLEKAIEIAQQFPQIGVFGGTVSGEYEVPVPSWIEPYLEALAVREIARDRWANDYSWSDAVPYGAGMCVRKTVARHYAASAEKEPLRREISRVGANKLTSCEDVDTAWTAIDLGLGTGVFRKLKAVHLIRAERISEEYVVRLLWGTTYSYLVLRAARGLSVEWPTTGWRDVIRMWAASVRLRGPHRRIFFAKRQATKSAWRMLYSCKETSH
jgi:glycosyltransferase involved in cell wall biosynthesis